MGEGNQIVKKKVSRHDPVGKAHTSYKITHQDLPIY